VRRLYGITRDYIQRQYGVDIGRRPVEVASIGHAINGGLRIEPSAESTVGSLFAGGESAGGPHGADRLGGNMNLTCQVFGKRAGRSAAERARGAGRQALRPEIVRAEEERLNRLGTRRGRLGPGQMKRAIQECMWRHLLIVRSDESLRACLAQIERLRDEIADLNAQGPQQVMGALEVESLLTVGEIMARCALLRTESRGSHYREDYPVRDDGRWETSIIARRRDGRTELYTQRLPRLSDGT
jgi:succinate dehydrogenase/fumarate reductase flavoprotein subunit